MWLLNCERNRLSAFAVSDFEMRKLRYVVYAEEGSFVSQCLDVDVASCGDTEDEAVSNLKEALELRFEGEPSDAFPASRVVRLGELTLH